MSRPGEKYREYKGYCGDTESFISVTWWTHPMQLNLTFVLKVLYMILVFSLGVELHCQFHLMNFGLLFFILGVFSSLMVMKFVLMILRIWRSNCIVL